VRVVRQADGVSFWGELTDEIAPARDADGRVDIQGTMQIITGIVEGWVREHPEQWLWLHRRWRCTWFLEASNRGPASAMHRFTLHRARDTA